MHAADCITCTNIRNARINATERSVIDGTAWYATTGEWMKRYATTIDKSPHIAAAVFAAFSINTKWALNKRYAERFIDMYANGTHRNFTGTLSMNINKAIAYIEQDVHNFKTMVKDPNNFKIRNFTCNLTDDCIHDIECVTVDRWAHRIATNFGDCARRDGCTVATNRKIDRKVPQFDMTIGWRYVNDKHSCGHVPAGNEYQQIAECYRTVAREFNESARTLQAITWIEFAGGVED